MKKFLTFMLLLVATFVLFACGENEQENNNEGEHTHEYVNGECECGEKDPSIKDDNKDEILPEAIAITQPETTNVVAGAEVTLAVTYTPANTNQKALTWESSDKAIATVDKGVVKFVGAGSVTITATSTKVASVKSNVTFTVVLPELETLEVKGSNKVVLREDSSIQLTAAATPQYADNSVTWVSSNEAVATVSQDGVVTPVSLGTTTITITSTINEEITATLEVEVFAAPVQGDVEVTEVTIEGTNVLYFGYGARLTANVYPLNANQGVTWESSNPSVVSVDEDGYIEGLAVDKNARIRAKSIANPDIASSWHRVEVIPDPDEPTVVDMQGYKIVIMNASSALNEIDPHLEGYKASDRQAKIKAWDDAEAKYNCDISVEAYPDTATWGTPRRTYITDNATNGTVPADLYTISSAWLAGFVDADAALDITEYYEKYGKGQMEPGQLGAGTIGGGLYIASTGTSKAKNYVDHGLYYNIDEIAKYGVKDPAEMFMAGEWTHTNFENWAKELQTALPEGSYAIGGHPYYYWLGMTAASGIKIVDYQTLEINVDSTQSEESMKLLNRLVVAGAMNPTADWAEGGAGENGFFNKTTLMTSGRFWFIHADNRWYKGMWEEDVYPNIGYVPYPYPDGMNKEDTRVTVTGGTVYMYAKGRVYGDGFGAEEVYRVINEMYLNTIIIQKTQPTYDAEEELRTILSTKLGNEASIEAAMFFTARRAMYDPTETVYASTATSVFNAVTKDIVYNGTDYQNAVAAVKDSFLATVQDQLG